jgi:hypothetical protein
MFICIFLTMGIVCVGLCTSQFQSPMTSGFSNYQGGAVQNVETVNQCQFPVHGNSENFQTYPIQYPSQSNYGQTTVYYSNVPTSTPQMGLVYNSNQGTFQSQIQPSQTNGKWLTFNCNRRLLPLCLNRIHKTYIRILHILWTRVKLSLEK